MDTRPRIAKGRAAGPPRPEDTSAEEIALVGAVVDGRYRLDELIGRGGMGVVYRGEHVSIRRKVAVKILVPALAGVPELRSRFEREAMAIGRIDHPNCVGVFDIGAMKDGGLYLVMEYLEGEQLGDVLVRERKLGPERAMHVMRHVLRGLEHIHAQGIIHRDIKLDNIMLVEQEGDTDFAKILDFGIAKAIGADLDDGVKLTQAGIAFGTPLYMAPEQALGNPLDGRADIYAASVMGYELLTGRPPFYSDDKIELLSMHTTREPPPMRELMPKGSQPVPLAVEALIRKGLAKRPAERIQTATDYISEIDEALSNTSPVSRAESMGWTGAHPLVTQTGSSKIIDDSDPMTGLPGAIDLLPGVPLTGAAPRISAPRIKFKTPRLRSLWVYVAGLGIAGLLGVAVAVLTHDDDEAPVELTVDTAAGAAAKELEKGNPLRAIKILESVKDQIQSDPLAQLQLGHALSATRANVRALKAYELALVLAPSLEADPALRANLLAMTNDKDPQAVNGSFAILINRTKVPDVTDKLLATAVDPDIDRRWAVLPLIETLGLGDKIDYLLVYGMDLEQGETCERRKRAVAKLRALGDARAIPPLERALVKKSKGRRPKPINGCLIDDAASALQYLRGLAGQSPTIVP